MTLLLHLYCIPGKYRNSIRYKYIRSYEQTLSNVNTLNFYLKYIIGLSFGTDRTALFLYTSLINKYNEICDCRDG